MSSKKHNKNLREGGKRMPNTETTQVFDEAIRSWVRIPRVEKVKVSV